MENWLNIEGLERGIRNSFLINKKPTEVEIYHIRGLFAQAQRSITSIENLLGKLKTPSFERRITNQITEETTYLLSIGESLKEIIDHDEDLSDQFVFDIARIKKKIVTILRKISQLPQ